MPASLKTVVTLLAAIGGIELYHLLDRFFEDRLFVSVMIVFLVAGYALSRPSEGARRVGLVALWAPFAYAALVGACALAGVALPDVPLTISHGPLPESAGQPVGAWAIVLVLLGGVAAWGHRRVRRPEIRAYHAGANVAEPDPA